MKFINSLIFLGKNDSHCAPDPIIIKQIASDKKNYVIGFCDNVCVKTFLKNITFNPDIENIYVLHPLSNLFFDKNIIKKVHIYSKTHVAERTIKINQSLAISCPLKENIINIAATTDEYQYLDLINSILVEDTVGRDTRNSKTFAVFGKQLEFNLSKGFPLLTTKKMFWRGIIEELLFILRGETNTNILSGKGINIWKGNTTCDFLRDRGLDYVEGDMGPMYGFILRHQGVSDYKGFDKKYEGYDQLKYVIELLLNNPFDRRIMMTTFDPSLVSKSVLAPCHGLIIQFYVRSSSCNMYIDCKMYQRSADVFLGLPFNIGSYAALIHILAHVTGYLPGKLIISLGDSHIYNDHIDQCIEQLYRIPKEFPTLTINREFVNKSSKNVDDIIKFIEELEFTDFKLDNYKSHPNISAKMVA